jgi:hypothetical protein
MVRTPKRATLNSNARLTEDRKARVPRMR